jgi:hypothetical protein
MSNKRLLSQLWIWIHSRQKTPKKNKKININFTATGGAVIDTGGAVCKGATPSVEQ